MKKYFFGIALLTNAFVINAQTKQGTIIFERKADVHRHMEDEQMKAMVPQFQTTKNELTFKENISVYKEVPPDNAPDPFQNNGGPVINIKIGGPGENTVLYRNYTNMQVHEQTELEDKTYIIDDTIHAMQWKLSDETKTILDHVCKKATTKTERGFDVTAWYAADMPVPVGPEGFGGLPGAILSVDVNNADIVYTATEINGDANEKELKEPSKGTHLSRADFDKKLDELIGPATPDGKRIIKQVN